MICETHSVGDWLALHDLDTDFASEAARFTQCHLPTPFKFPTQRIPVGRNSVCYKPHEFVNIVVIPALSNLVGSNDVGNLLKSTEIKIVDQESLPEGPYIIHKSGHGNSVIFISWESDAEHALLLAHEVSHALQVQLSTESPMPPLAREMCAFLGELAVLDFASTFDDDLFLALYREWDRRMRDDINLGSRSLLRKIENVKNSYEYSMNYPFARYLAGKTYGRLGPQWTRSLFASGSTAMSYLDMKLLIEPVTELHNYLPQYGQDCEFSAIVTEYRKIGALILLDIEDWRIASRLSIEDYFEKNVAQLKSGELQIQFDSDLRPVGYIRPGGTSVVVFG